MTTNTESMPDAIRSDDGVGQPSSTQYTSVDDLGNPSRTERDNGGPDCRHDPDFGPSGSAADSNSSLF